MRTLQRHSRRNLHKRFRRLSLFGRTKLVVFLPILVALFAVNELVDFTVFMISALLEYLRNAAWDARTFVLDCRDMLRNEAPYRVEAYRRRR